MGNNARLIAKIQAEIARLKKNLARMPLGDPLDSRRTYTNGKIAGLLHTFKIIRDLEPKAGEL